MKPKDQDHGSSHYQMIGRKPRGARVSRKSLFLSEFDIRLEHVPGTKMVILDTLSRRPDLCQEENNNDDMKLLPDTLFVSAIDLALKDLLATAGQNDSITRDALQTFKEGPAPATSTLADWMVEDGLTFYKFRGHPHYPIPIMKPDNHGSAPAPTSIPTHYIPPHR